MAKWNSLEKETSMKRIITTLLILLMVSGTFAQTTEKKRAVIIFTGEKSNNTRTYLGKLKKGDPYRLNDYLRSGTSNQTDAPTDANFSLKEYEPRSDRNETNYLSDDYKINENRLKKGKSKYRQKYLDEKEKAFSPKKKHERPIAREAQVKKKDHKPRKAETRLAKKFKIKGKHLRKGKKLRYPAGNVSLLLTYDVKTDNTVKTYVTNLNVKVESGKKYYLNYYGNESKRKYYLEAATTP